MAVRASATVDASSDAPRLLTGAPFGSVTKAAFCQHFIQAGMAHADADVANSWTQSGLWFCAACTMVNTGGADVNSLAVTPATPANPADVFAVGAWHSSRKEQLERRAGVVRWHEFSCLLLPLRLN